MLKELVLSTDPILKQSTVSFDFENPPMNPMDLAEEMRYNMITHRGIGLAAPQIGYNYSVFAVGNPDVKESILVFFNPRIVHYSDDLVLMEEGCLSFPGVTFKIKRPSDIRMRFTGATGITETMRFNGMTARVVQHEYDHLHGITFDMKVNKFHLEKAKRRKTLNNRKKRKKHLTSA